MTAENSAKAKLDQFAEDQKLEKDAQARLEALVDQRVREAVDDALGNREAVPVRVSQEFATADVAAVTPPRSRKKQRQQVEWDEPYPDMFRQ